jgi:subtilisin family serine protease
VNLKPIRRYLAAILVASIGALSLSVPATASQISPRPSVSTKAPLQPEADKIRGFLLDTTGFSPRFADLSFSLGSRFYGDGISWGRGLLGQYRSIELPAEVSEDDAELMARELSLKFGSRVIPQITFRKTVEADLDATLSGRAVQAGPTWGLDRIDQRALPLDSRYEYENNGTGVTVYVVDTGILASHNEFAGRIAPGFSSIDDGQGTTDCEGHGTHVAGTVGGTNYGVAKDVTLVPVRVLDCEGSGSDSTVISGIEWVIDNHSGGPAVMNLSLGGSYSAALNLAVRRAYEAGIVVVVASGNDGVDACSDSPASEPTAITVNASTSTDDDASFSNYGSCTDIYAPGQGILSADIGGSSQTASLSGTSMASPHVAGAAALILERNPNLTPAQVWSQMADAATDIDWYYTPADAKILLFTGSELSSFANPPTPSISGTAATGETLSADPGDWSATCDCTPTFEYAWLRNGNPISGATELTYDLQGSDNGTRISFRITASADGFVDAVVTSNQTDRVSAGFTTASTPTITGTATSGQTLRVSSGSWSPRPRFSYQWNCDGEPISRATRSSLRLSGSHNDCMITVSVRATARNVATTTRVSEPVGPVGTQFSSTPAPTISGSAGYENVLTASVGSWSPTPTTLNFQWYYGDGSAIDGAIDASYLVSDGDYGNSIYVCVTGQRSGYVETVRCSTETDSVLGYVLSLTPTPEIIGAVGIGNTVSVDVGTWDDGVTHIIQWLRNGSPITGENETEYLVTNSDSGASISVSVTGELDGYSSVTMVSVQHGPVAMAFTRAPDPSISGTFRDRSSLRVKTGSWSPRPRFSYQWYRDGEPISRATRTSYRLTSSDVGSRITVAVTATARGYTTVTKFSAESSLVASRP